MAARTLLTDKGEPVGAAERRSFSPAMVLAGVRAFGTEGAMRSDLIFALVFGLFLTTLLAAGIWLFEGMVVPHLDG